MFHLRKAIAAAALATASLAVVSTGTLVPAGTAAAAGQTTARTAHPSGSAPRAARTVTARHRAILRASLHRISTYAHTTGTDRARLDQARVAHQASQVALLTQVIAQREAHAQAQRAALAARAATYRTKAARSPRVTG